MRILPIALLVVATTFASLTPTVAAEPGGECGRGPYESVRPADLSCCDMEYGGCFYCDVWVEVAGVWRCIQKGDLRVDDQS